MRRCETFEQQPLTEQTNTSLKMIGQSLKKRRNISRAWRRWPEWQSFSPLQPVFTGALGVYLARKTFRMSPIRYFI